MAAGRQERHRKQKQSARPHGVCHETHHTRVHSGGASTLSFMGSPPTAAKFGLRLAKTEDLPELEALIAASVHGLQKDDYTQAQRDGALHFPFGVDTQLITDGTYF